MSDQLFLVLAFIGSWSLFFGVTGLILEKFIVNRGTEND